MRKHLLFFVLLLFGQFAIGQIDTIKISGTKFISTRQILSNENKTKDTVLYLYRLDNRQRKLVKKFYLYKDEGEDCNNLFWNIGTMTTQNDSLIFLTRYLQKGHDPIPVIRKEFTKLLKVEN